MSYAGPIDTEMQALMEQITDRPVGLVKAPADMTPPFYIVQPMAGPDAESTLGDPNSIADYYYQITISGVSGEQLQQAEQRLIAGLTANWASIPGVMGPPLVRRNGSVPGTATVMASVVIAIMKVSG